MLLLVVLVLFTSIFCKLIIKVAEGLEINANSTIVSYLCGVWHYFVSQVVEVLKNMIWAGYYEEEYEKNFEQGKMGQRPLQWN